MRTGDRRTDISNEDKYGRKMGLGTRSGQMSHDYNQSGYRPQDIQFRQIADYTPTTKKSLRRDVQRQLSEAEYDPKSRKMIEKQNKQEKKEYNSHLIGRLKMHTKVKKFLEEANRRELFHHQSDQKYLISLVEKEDYENLSSALIHVLLVLMDKGYGKPNSRGPSRGRIFINSEHGEIPAGTDARNDSQDPNLRSEINFLSDQGELGSVEPEFYQETADFDENKRNRYSNQMGNPREVPERQLYKPRVGSNTMDRKVTAPSKNDSNQTKEKNRSNKYLSPEQPMVRFVEEDQKKFRGNGDLSFKEREKERKE